MYCQLLAMAVADEEPGGAAPVEHDLVRRLAEIRARLATRPTPGGQAAVDAIESLADHVDYDRTLLRLCRLRGIACSADRFGRPDAERRRLETALVADGLALAGTRSGPGR